MGKATNCDNCGVCCMGQNLLPLTGRQLDIADGFSNERLPPRLEKPLLAILNGPLLGDDGPCEWLNRATGRCRYHKYRPSFCQDFQVGGEDCLRIRMQAGVDR